MANTTPNLPPETVQRLNAAKTDTTDKTALYSLVADLTDAEWPLRSIAQALGVSRTTAHNYSRRGTSARPEGYTPPADTPTKPIDTYGAGLRAKRIPLDVPPAELPRLKELYESARKKTRWSNQNSPEVKDSTELGELLLKYRRRKIPLATIAKHLGVTRRALAQRIENFDV